VSEARYSKIGEVLGYFPHSSSTIRVITYAPKVVTPRERKEIILSSQPISSMTENDLQFEWLLCLASTLQASRRQQIRVQAEAFITTRPKSDKTKYNANFEWLLFLTSELQASQHL
jgi:hypothetical protein